jgi:5'(3')-deoxyribonucleotidase
MTNTFYLDMDGVVADWESAASSFLGRPMRDPDTLTHYRNTVEEWERIKTQTRFYRDLPLMPRVDELVHLARQYRDTLGWNLLFLTAVPAKDDVPWAFYDKVLWAQERFPDIPVHFGPHSYDKFKHCRVPGDILVDDRPDNCEQWRSAGGMAFKVNRNDLGSVLDLIAADLRVKVDLKNQRDLALDLV